MKCSTARRVIDDASSPANLPYEAAEHVQGCRLCRQFAEEREQLRKLLLEPLRVTAPSNFEAMVARRLAKRADEKRPFWLAGGFYLRAAGAAVALASLLLVAQVTLFKYAPLPGPQEMAVADHPPAPATRPTGGEKAVPPSTPTIIGKGTGSPFSIRRVHRASLRAPSERTVAAAITDMTRAVLLVRNPGSEHEIAVPMVSVGAQPWLSVIHSQGERGVRAAF